MMYQQELETGLRAVRKAAELCRSVQSAIDGDALEKKDRSPVTIADYGSQAIICRAIRSVFPDDPIIAEEDSKTLREGDGSGFLDAILSEFRKLNEDVSPDEVCRWIDYGNAKSYSDRFWTLDPIDGTKGFLRKQQYAISLALIVDGKVTVSVVGCPNLPAADGASTGSLLSAVAGEGATTRGFDAESSPAPIHVSKTEGSDDARFCESYESLHSSHSDSARIAESLGITKEPVRLDSQAKYAIVARGEADIYLRLVTRPGYIERIWDHAGGVLLVQEAGGTVTDVSGKPLDFSCGAGLENNAGVVVTNGLIHDQVLKAASFLNDE